MNEKNYKEIVASILIDIKSIKFSFKNPYTLTSGHKSPVYVDCRKIISFVKERNQIINIAKKYIEENISNYDLLAGGETAGIPYASFLSQIMNKKMIYIRKVQIWVNPLSKHVQTKCNEIYISSALAISK